DFTRRPAMAGHSGDERARRSRLVVALLDAAHHGRADAAFRSKILLQYSAAIPPGSQLPAHPGHHFAALTADAVPSRQEAVPGLLLPRSCSLIHEAPSHQPPQWPTTTNRTLCTEPLVRYDPSIEHRACRSYQRLKG